jgi:SAM-dependent methyltransferase
MKNVTLRYTIILTGVVVHFMACGQVKPDPEKMITSPYKKGIATRDGIGKYYHGREIAKTMDFAGAPWLERDERNEEENAEMAIRYLPISKNAVVADLGAGTGYYSFRIAEKIPEGKVYAIDIQPSFVEFLGERKKERNAQNLYPLLGNQTNIGLEKASVDLLLMVDVYHELEFPEEMLKAIYHVLKPDGKLVLIEFRGEDPTVPIKELHKMTVAQIRKELKPNGFSLSQKKDFLPIQHFLIFEKTEKR